MEENPKGRLDILLLKLGEAVCSRIKAHTGVDLWEGDPANNQSGLKTLTNEFIDQCGIPRAPIDIPRTLAAALAGKGDARSIGPSRTNRQNGTARIRRRRRDYGL